MRHNPRPYEVYKHFKGNLYQILAVAEHSENGELLVIYQALYGGFKIYARPLDMFMEKVDTNKYPDAGQEYRFELQQPQEKTENANAKSETALGECKPVMARIEEQQEQNAISSAAEEEIPDIDPLVLQFLDADSYEERLNILAGLHHRITDDMLTTMAVVSDIELSEGDTEQRYLELKNCLVTLEKYECNRLR